MKYIIYTDGGSRGNPGHAASAFIITDEKSKKLEEKGYYLGIGTNNEAEYSAIEKALEFLINTYPDVNNADVEVRADSQLIVNQLLNLWKLKNERLKTFYYNIKNLENKIGKVNYKYIPRSENKDADLIVNITLDTQLKTL